MKKIVFATNNPNKLEEVRSELKDRYEVLSLKDINCFEELPETHPTLEQNAHQKAQYVYEHYGYDCFADDTGLLVEALDGEPGVYSARYAGSQRDANDNMNLVLEKMADKSNRQAKFQTVICYVKGGEVKYFQGEVQGEIAKDKSGVAGFGYDPIFKPEGDHRSFAEYSQEEKNAISHRGRAVRKFIAFLADEA